MKTKPLSKKSLLKDNQKMLGTIKWLERVMDEQLAENLKLQTEIERLKNDINKKHGLRD